MKVTAPIFQFIRESQAELLKVVWPKRQEVLKFTMVVIAAILIATLIVAIFDIGLIKIVQFFVVK